MSAKLSNSRFLNSMETTLTQNFIKIKQ